MSPTLHDGEYIVVDTVTVRINRVMPKWFSLKRGDIVLFTRVPFEAASLDGERWFVKRIKGLPGDKVRVVNNRAIVNAAPVYEPYVVGSTTDFLSSWPLPTAESVQRDVVVPRESVFVLGDNRGRSSDSRVFGSVPIAEVLGRVIGSIRF
jgi:signal peptidase I